MSPIDPNQGTTPILDVAANNAATTASTATIKTVTPTQTLASKLLGDLFTVGIGAAAIFVKNPNHQNTAASIITVLQPLLSDLESWL